MVVQNGAVDGALRRSSVALLSSASEAWGCYSDAAELARCDLRQPDRSM